MFTTIHYLYCDGDSFDCECIIEEVDGTKTTCEATGGEGSRTRTAYKKDMQENGWKFMADNKSYCPECAKKLKS